MAARRFLLTSRRFPIAPALAALAALLVVAAPAALGAEDEPEVPNAKYNFMGEITSNGVTVRSGPRDDYYPTAKLDKGTSVKVVGIKYDWLKIEPPPGSFSYVAKAFIDRHGDGMVGKVNNNANVRAGSSLNPMKTTIQTKLLPGVEVKITGDEDEYYRIEPPAGAYLYVAKQSVRPISVLPDRNQGIAQQPGTANDNAGGGAQANTGTGGGASGNSATAPDPLLGADAGARGGTGADTDTPTATTSPSGDNGVASRPGGNASQPSGAASADAKFEQLEADFADASHKPVVEQPLGDLLNRYQQVAQEEALPESLKRVADARVAALKVRQDAREQLFATRKSQEEMRQRNKALVAERQELEERIKETEVDFYTAVGTLRPSSLQQGPRGTVLYRLTDPDTGRTLVYVRSASTQQVAPLLNQFVGVRGELKKDSLLRLNVIQPTEAKAIDQSRLGNGIAAAVMPPSLLPKIPTVSTESQNAPVEGQ